MLLVCGGACEGFAAAGNAADTRHIRSYTNILYTAV